MGVKQVGLAVVIALAGLAAAAGVVVPASAQQVEIKAQPPARERMPEIIPPGLYNEVTKPRESDFYPDGPKVEHDPAFIEPFSATYQTPTMTGRYGLSGWTAPNTPVGSTAAGTRQDSGWFAIGFSITWDGPPPARRGPVR
jgi:hypothetical protein